MGYSKLFAARDRDAGPVVAPAQSGGGETPCRSCNVTCSRSPVLSLHLVVEVSRHFSHEAALVILPVWAPVEERREQVPGEVRPYALEHQSEDQVEGLPYDLVEGSQGCRTLEADELASLNEPDPLFQLAVWRYGCSR